MRMRNGVAWFLAFVICLCGLVPVWNGGMVMAESENLMEEVSVDDVEFVPATEEDAAAMYEFGVKLLKQCQETKTENPLISPYSLLNALGMTMNGAEGDTLKQMEAALGFTSQRLAQVLGGCTNTLQEAEEASEVTQDGDKISGELLLANGIWFRKDDEFQPKEEFLKENAGYYHAGLYEAPFDASTVEDINDFISENTNGKITKVLDDLSPEDVMCLVNALSFEANWQDRYLENDVIPDSTFTRDDGTKQNCTMMKSSEKFLLSDPDGLAQGFLKYYTGNHYAYALLLPSEGVTAEQYLEKLTGDRLAQILKNNQYYIIDATMPKFETNYAAELSDAFIAMGMTDAFDSEKADFSGMDASGKPSLSISSVLHNTSLTVDEKGTKAGAATVVVMSKGMSFEQPLEIVADRPFLYVILDMESYLPLFIGIVTSME